jgi:hypothetical protein
MVTTAAMAAIAIQRRRFNLTDWWSVNTIKDRQCAFVPLQGRVSDPPFFEHSVLCAPVAGCSKTVTATHPDEV